MRFLFCTFALLCLLPTLTTAQTTIGFEDPADLSNILEYRLPDWGWLTWDLDGEINGSGSHHYAATSFSQASHDRSDNAARLASVTRYLRENENLFLYSDLILNGTWDNSRQGHGPAVHRNEDISGQYRIYGIAQQYLGQSSWFANGSLMSIGNYNEVHRSRSDHEEDREETIIENTGSHHASVGLGFGRIRDVTPLIRASRLSERLVALGRPRLTERQIQKVAQVLAQEYGYRIVFDRPDRRFWSDVLDPMIPGEPLTVAEIFYLTDVLQENLGTRNQGYELAVQGTYRRLGGGDEAENEPSARCYASGSKNLSLDWQVYGSFSTEWRWRNGIEGAENDSQYSHLGLGVLWSIADRILMDGTIMGKRLHTDYEEVDVSFTDYDVRAEITLDVFIEDRLSLRPVAGVVWGERSHDQEDGIYNRTQSWHYGLSINYRLEGLLF